MPRKAKFKQKNTKGCMLCGDPTVGRGIQAHVKNIHDIPYEVYKKCFNSGKILTNTLIDTGVPWRGKLNKPNPSKVMIHVFVRRFIVRQ